MSLCGTTAPAEAPLSAVSSDGFLLNFTLLCFPAGCSWFVNSATILPCMYPLADNGALYVIDAVLGHGASGPYPPCTPLQGG